MLAFLSVSINSIAAQSTGNVVFAVLYDCKIMMSVDWFSYSFINVDFFFHSSFSNFSAVSLLVNLVWNV